MDNSYVGDFDISHCAAFIINQILKTSKQTPESSLWKQTLLDSGILKHIFRFLTPAIFLGSSGSLAPSNSSQSLSALASHSASSEDLVNFSFQFQDLVEVGCTLLSVLAQNSPPVLNEVYSKNINFIEGSDNVVNIYLIIKYLFYHIESNEHAENEGGGEDFVDKVRCLVFSIIVSLTTGTFDQVHKLLDDNVGSGKYSKYINLPIYGIFEQINSVLSHPRLKSTLYATGALMNIAYSGLTSPDSSKRSSNYFFDLFQKHNSIQNLVSLYSNAKSNNVKTYVCLGLSYIYSSSLDPTRVSNFPGELVSLIPSILSKNGILKKKGRDKVIQALTCISCVECLYPIPATVKLNSSPSKDYSSFKSTNPVFSSLSSAAISLDSKSNTVPQPISFLLWKYLLFNSTIPVAAVILLPQSFGSNSGALPNGKIIRYSIKYYNAESKSGGNEKKKKDEEEEEDEAEDLGVRLFSVGFWRQGKGKPPHNDNINITFNLGIDGPSEKNHQGEGVGFYNNGNIYQSAGSNNYTDITKSLIQVGHALWKDDDLITVEFNGTNPDNHFAVFYVNNVLQKFKFEKIPEDTYIAVFFFFFLHKFQIFAYIN
jgi:hypothetical protein